MDNTLADQVKKRLAELPEDVRRAIQSADLGKKIREIGGKHHLHIDQSATLEEEVLLVMLGFSDPGELPQQLVKRVRMSEAEAAATTEDLGREIFMPIRESMKRFMEERAEEAEADEHVALVLAAKPPETKSAAATPAPATTPAPVVPAQAPVAPPAPAVAPVAPKPATPLVADLALSQKTITAPKAPAPAAAPAKPAAPAPQANKPPAPPKPGGYTADPYREPTE